MTLIEEMCRKLNFKPRTLIEIGPGSPDENCRINNFIKNGYNCILIEANPRSYYYCSKGYENGQPFWDSYPNFSNPPHTNPGYSQFPNCIIHNIAIVDKPGKVKFYERAGSSFVEGIASPAKINDNYIENEKDAYIIDGYNINKFDNGEIDILVSDSEGSEFFCIRDLISRPRLIILETHYVNNNYINPYINEINSWMIHNRYIIAEKDDSDTCYLRIGP